MHSERIIFRSRYQHTLTNMDSGSDWDNCSVFSFSPSLSSYDDCDESIYSWPSFDYFEYPDDHIKLYYCPCCGPPLPQDELLAQHFEKEDNYSSWKFAPYRDLRSAARSRRPRKRQDRRMCNSYQCRKQGQAWADTRNTKAKREIKRFAVLESQKESIQWTSDGRIATYRHNEWDIHQPEELDDEIDSMNDIERYSIFHQQADIFESPETYIEVGEDFSTWCQRRIGEMRSVKEARLRSSSPPTTKPMIWHRKRDGGYLRRYNIYTGDKSTTTLPTNAYDALGHELLHSILTPSRWWKRKQTIPQASLFQPVNGFRWFGEYEWEWYRDASGGWEIGCGRLYNGQRHRHTPVDKCPYCCGEEIKVGEECCCGGNGIKPAPEERQSCWLLEWVGEEGREIVRREQQLSNIRLESADNGLEEQNDAWEVCSSVSSDIWSVVDAAS